MVMYLHLFVYLSSTASRKDEVASIRSKFPQKVPVNDPTSLDIMMYHRRVSYRGGGGWNSPPEILKLSMVLSQVLNNNLVSDCIRSNLRGSKFKIFLGGGGACPQTPLVGMHAHTCMRAFMRYYHPASILFFFSQLKIL